MQGFMDIIRGRRSVRKHEDKEVPQEAFNAILESVKWAPSWTNTQCWEIIIEIMQLLTTLGLCRIDGMLRCWNHGIMVKNA